MYPFLSTFRTRASPISPLHGLTAPCALLNYSHYSRSVKVLEDHGRSLDERHGRARALLVMGDMFLGAKGSDEKSRGQVDAKGHIDRAMKATQAAAQGQEYDPADFDAASAAAAGGPSGTGR